MNPQQPFSSLELKTRLHRVLDAMAAQELDLLIINAPENIYYLTGYQTKGVFANQFLAVSNMGRIVFMTRRIEIGNLMAVIEESPIQDYDVYGDTDDPVAVFVHVLQRNNLQRGRVGVEKRNWYLLVDHYERLRAALPDANFVDASALVETIRLIKSPIELEYHRRAGVVAVKAMRAAIDAVGAGRTDGSVAAAALGAMIEAGGEWIAGWPNVACGRRTSLAHATWANVPIEPGDAVAIELAGVVRRYHTPLWRTVIMSPVPPDLRRLAAVIRDANETGLQYLRSGVTAGEVHRRVRATIAKAGFADLPGIRLGYTVGVGFPPVWSQQLGVNIVPDSETVLQACMVFHFLTFVILMDKYGLGQSSSVAITEQGYENLTPGIAPGPLFVE